MKKPLAIVTSAMFAMLTLMPAMLRAQDSTPPPPPPKTGAKQDIKDAGHSTKRAATKTGSATKKTVKKGVNKGAEGTRKGAGKVEDKTEP
jgi:hypothetical protein